MERRILLIARGADVLGLPFVLTTSTHHHDILTQPIQDYASRRSWKLIDCGPSKEEDKASPEFWERVCHELEKRII